MLRLLQPLAVGGCLLVLTANGVGCSTTPPPAIVDCDPLAEGLVRDECILERMSQRGPGAYLEVHGDAKAIADPIVRATGIYGWLRVHGDRTTPEQGQALCGLLLGDEQRICMRRQSAAHLSASQVDNGLPARPPTGPANPGGGASSPPPPPAEGDGMEATP